MKAKKRGLGRGLSALLENAETDITTKVNVAESNGLVGTVSALKISEIETNPFQPRTSFEEVALNELVDSIRIHGIIQPVTVRKLGYDKFQLISGERRLRAAQIVGLKEIPTYVRIANDQSMLEMALVENIQRLELDPIEIAISYKRLIEECDLTHDELSKKVSKSRSNITNFLRLLKLPVEVQEALRQRIITMGHARSLVNVESAEKQIALLNKILEESLSVRDVEEISQEVKREKISSIINGEALSFEQQKVITDLTEYLKTKVDIKRSNKGRGKIVIPFDNDESFRRIVELLNL